MINCKKRLSDSYLEFCKNWKDERKYSSRLLLAFIVSFSMCFTFLFFGPFEIVVSNVISMAVTPIQIAPIMAILTIALSVVITFTISLLKGNIFNFVITSIFALTVCGYVQGNFLDSQVSVLNGVPVIWEHEAIDMLINCGIWFVIFVVLFSKLHISKGGVPYWSLSQS